MFHRILVEDWQRALTIASFTLFFGVFLVTLLRVARMQKKEVRRLENLPLEQETHE
jgi:hypothetical protein